MASFMCDIVTPDAKLASVEAEMVVVPGAEGSMGFLAGHEPLVSVLSDGEARIKAAGSGETKSYVLQGGYVEVSADKVIILADRAVSSDEIDATAVRENLAVVEGKMASLTAEEIAKTTLASDKVWYETQLRVVNAA
ncbi:ATP synthase F1 subunit epsilon [Adlercreutzia agrestimuris]|uniref:ATP synthase F1 subunit epsilon n=1 Tax=Adlercreutzia agrestimuris TaxID=2941324 RepID=UPI00203DD154|nr:ATP synthase F1 subunit epsilon [Adlercreutzia agrestimuris]